MYNYIVLHNVMYVATAVVNRTQNIDWFFRMTKMVSKSLMLSLLLKFIGSTAKVLYIPQYMRTVLKSKSLTCKPGAVLSNYPYHGTLDQHCSRVEP